MLLNEKSFSINKKSEISKDIENLKKKDKNEISKLDVTKIVKKIYQKKPESIAEETIEVFELIRICVMVGLPFLIHPVLGLVGWITDKIISEKVHESQKDKYLTKYQKEIDKVDKKLERGNLKPNVEKDLRDLKRHLQDGKGTLERYFDGIEKYKEKDEKKEE